MLKNLIKYEFKATGRTLGLLYAALIIIACVSRLILGLNNFNDGMGGSAFPFVGIISTLIVFLYAMFLCAVVVITFIVILLRFYKNLLQNEGYLMNMLPVKSWQHITAKLIAAVVWSFVSVLVVIVSVLILSTLAVDFSSITFSVLGDAWNNVKYGFSQMGVSGVYILFMTLVMVVASTVASVLQLYAAMSIGQTQNRYKAVCSFAAYIAISVVFQIISVILMSVSGSALMDSSVNILVGSMAAGSALNIGITVTALYCLVKCVILFFITNYFMKNKLNLE